MDLQRLAEDMRGASKFRSHDLGVPDAVFFWQVELWADELDEAGHSTDSIRQTLIECITDGPLQLMGRLLWRLKLCVELLENSSSCRCVDPAPLMLGARCRKCGQWTSPQINQQLTGAGQ